MSEAAHPNVQIKSESDKALGKRKAEVKAEACASAEECEDTDDGECMEVDLAEASGAAPNVTPETRDDEDEDCQITGRSGSLALSDVRPCRLDLPRSLSHHFGGRVRGRGRGRGRGTGRVANGGRFHAY